MNEHSQEGAMCRALSARIRGLSIEELGDLFRTARELRQNFVEPGSPGAVAGLLFGQIQSGKTNRMLASIAYAADNGYRCFIVLTSDNLWLYDQTFKRVRASLGLKTVSIRDVSDLASAPEISANLRTTGVVLLATKNVSVLSRLQEFCESRVSNDIPTVIFDDEADQASLDNFVNVQDQDPSAINAAITALRDYFTTNTYVQITATPQSLYLQRADGDYRPSFTVLFEPGAFYVGSDEFFGDSSRPKYLSEIPSNDIVQIVNHTVGSGAPLPQSLRRAICTFLVGGASKILLDPDGDQAFCFLAHVSQRQTVHSNLRDLIETFIATATDTLFGASTTDAYNQLVRDLTDAHDELSVDTELPAFSEILETIQTSIGSTDVQVLNASPNSGMPRFDSTYNILVGGNRLGRGVTIPRLLVTYYGRQVRTAQVDTVLQHARMYGYRRRDLDVTRCFLTDDLRDVFRVIHDSNAQLLRSVREDGLAEIQPIILNRSGSTPVRPSRSSALPLSALQVYLGGQAYFPRAPLASSVDVLDEELAAFVDLPEPVPVSIEFLVSILAKTKSDSADVNGSWDDLGIRVCAKRLIDICNNRGTILVRRDRNISKGKRALLSETDAQLYTPDSPHLTMYRINGHVADGWDPEGARWVPNFRFPMINGARRSFIFTPD